MTDQYLTWPKTPDDLWVVIQHLMERVTELEKKIHGITVAPFSAPGDFSENFFGTAWYAEHGYDITHVRASLGSSGSGDTTVTLYKNGDGIETLVIPSGELSVLHVWDDLAVKTMAAGDYFQVSCDGKGGGAADLTVLVRMVRTQ